MFHLLTGLIYLYVLWRFVFPLKLGVRWKVLIGIGLLGAAEHHLIDSTFFGTLASPELPAIVILLEGAMFCAFLFLAALTLARDLLALMLYIKKQTRPYGAQLLSSVKVALGMGLFSVVLSLFGAWQAIRVPNVRTVEIVIQNLSPALDGFRIVHLTDIHASSLLKGDWVAAVVEKTNSLDADIILVTGDMVDGTLEKRPNDVAPLRDLRAREGVYAVPGNHEYYANYLGWMTAFKAMGWHMLLNQHAVIGEDERSLIIAGITDRASAQFAQPIPDITAALNGAPRQTPIILLSHQPYKARENAAKGADLQLSGHTHGGQILGLQLLIKRANNGFVSGLYDVDGMKLYVSNGAGLWAGFPIRLGVPSEITEIMLRSPNRE